ICGCSEQKYLYSPAEVKVKEKVPSVSIAFDLNFPAETTVCGMSSWLVQVTVSPTFSFSSAGVKVKLSIVTLVSSARAPPRYSERAAAIAMRTPCLRKVADIIVRFLWQFFRQPCFRQPCFH